MPFATLISSAFSTAAIRFRQHRQQHSYTKLWCGTWQGKSPRRKSCRCRKACDGGAVMKKAVAIMQPYFVPYLGYFRLFSQTDLFVIYDCVQFPRRGYVHRNQVPDQNGTPQWLTLPLEKCDQKTAILDLQWRSEERRVGKECRSRWSAYH